MNFLYSHQTMNLNLIPTEILLHVLYAGLYFSQRTFVYVRRRCTLLVHMIYAFGFCLSK
uniref:F-box domain-containing protein n=1 Tax=Ascaris lumbricoides TaxID=6252 RepID=A0A0M3IPH3_ASCLU